MGIIVIIIVLIMACIGGFIGLRSGKKDNKSVNSQLLHKDLDEEHRRQGKTVMRPINGDTNTYARQDKTWKNAGDFFLQMFHGRRE